VFDSRKKMKATVASGVENKLAPAQRKIIDFNRALLFMYSNQVSLQCCRFPTSCVGPLLCDEVHLHGFMARCVCFSALMTGTLLPSGCNKVRLITYLLDCQPSLIASCTKWCLKN